MEFVALAKTTNLWPSRSQPTHLSVLVHGLGDPLANPGTWVAGLEEERANFWEGRAQERWRSGAVPLKHHLSTTQMRGFPMHRLNNSSCPQLWARLRLRFQHLPSRGTDLKPQQRGRGWRLSAGDGRQSCAEGASLTHANPATLQFAVVSGKNTGMVKSPPLCRSTTQTQRHCCSPGAAGAGRLWKALAFLLSFNGPFKFSLNSMKNSR